MTWLAAWLWQGMAIALATAVALGAARRLSAATRHAVWWLALVAVAALPAGYVTRLAWLALQAGTVSAAGGPLSDVAVPVPAAPGWLPLALAMAWAAAALDGYARIASSVRAVARLKRESTPFDQARAARLEMWRTVDALRRPELRVHPAVRGACALGLGRPVILLSPAILQFDDRRLDAIVMHELAHITRRDDWTQLLQALIVATCAFHPAVHVIGRRISIEREAACDDQVIALGGEPRDYARSLAEVSRAVPAGRWHAATIPGAVRSPSLLRQRVRRLLDPSMPRESRAALSASLASGVALAMAVALGVRAPAMVEFIDMRAAVPPAASLMARLLPAATPGPLGVGPASDPPRRSVRARAGALAEPQRSDDTSMEATGQATAIGELPPLEATPVAVRATGDVRLMALSGVPAAPRALATPSRSEQPDDSGPWMTLARATTSVGVMAGRAGASTGSGAREAGASIGRFFGRAGKTRAGGF